MTNAFHLLVLNALLALLGCAHLNDFANDRELRHHVDATYAAEYGELPKGRFARHFERGWKQGYYDAALGARITRPSVPSSAYLTRRYQTPQGHTKLRSWYAGYAQGSTAFRRDDFVWTPIQPTAPHVLTDHFQDVAAPIEEAPQEQTARVTERSQPSQPAPAPVPPPSL